MYPELTVDTNRLEWLDHVHLPLLRFIPKTSSRCSCLALLVQHLLDRQTYGHEDSEREHGQDQDRLISPSDMSSS
jgi:hypothetical protein